MGPHSVKLYHCNSSVWLIFQVELVDPWAHINGSSSMFILLVLNVGNGWVAGGCWDDYWYLLWIIPSFPAFSTSKLLLIPLWKLCGINKWIHTQTHHTHTFYKYNIDIYTHTGTLIIRGMRLTWYQYLLGVNVFVVFSTIRKGWLVEMTRIYLGWFKKQPTR